jgi:predicted ATP-grasp superfamily ATP-dependent carboligase
VAVHGVHSQRSPAARSRYFAEVHPWDGPLDDDALVPWLQHLARRIGRDDRPLLIPTGDASALLVEDRAEALRAHFRFPEQPPGLARALSSKRAMAELCVAHGVPTPQTRFPTSRADVEDYAEAGPFPVMLKAIDNHLLEQRVGLRMAVVRSAAELLDRYDVMEDPVQPNLMIQEYIPGGPDQVWMFNGYFDAHSKAQFGVTGKKLRQCPPATGSTSLGVCLANETVDQLTRRFMAAIGYRGILDCGYRYDARDGQYKLLDVNPRIGATFRLFVGDDGMDVARALYLDQTGQPVPPSRCRDGRKWLVENNDIISYRRGRKDGGPTVGPWLRSLRGTREAAWWAADDPAPFMAMGFLSARSVAGKIGSRRR